MSGTLTVLFLASDPVERGSAHLRLDQEAREIQHAIRQGTERDSIVFVSEWAVRTRDLQAALLRHRPQVVHFSGHGDGARGIIMEDDDGRRRAVRRDGLARLFGILGGSIRVVVLNACESLPTVDAFSGAVDYCIGMNRPITDPAAIVFSTAFYGALASGKNVRDAFGLGTAQLEIEDIAEVDVPVLRVRDGADDDPLIPPEAPEAREEEEHYLRTVVSRLDVVELYGGGKEAPGRMHISGIFTQPNLTLTYTRGQSVEDALRAAAGGILGGTEERILVRAVEAIAGVPRLVVLGEPGGGKSVLVSHVAVQMALRGLGQPGTDLPGWSAETRLMPVVVLLREFAEWLAGRRDESGPPRAGWLWEYLAHLLDGWGCAGALPAVREAIQDGRAAVFLDGLDEVPDTSDQPWRARIARAVQEFAAPVPGGRVVVTCRKYAYGPRDAWRLDYAAFPVVELGRFELGQVRDFATQWYLGVGRQQGWTAEESQRRSLQLYEQIKGSAYLRDLAGSPLLLTLMARIHRAEQALPDDRAQLYDRAIDLLLAEWENRKDEEWKGMGPGTVARLGVPTAALRAVLARLAFDAHAASARPESRAGGAAAVQEHELVKCLRALAGGMDAAMGFIDYIRVRAGLLALRDDGTYVFPHRTFQEYLAATHLLSRDGFAEALVERIREDFTGWREVFFLAAATLAGQPDGLAALADAVLVEVEDAEPAAALVQAAASVALAMADGPLVQRAGRVKRYARLMERMRDVLCAAMADDPRLAPDVRAAAGFALGRMGDPRPELRCPAAMAFRPVPRGPFWMGTAADDAEAYPEEVPLHRLEIAYDCWIGRFPVTVAQFRDFAQADGRPSAPAPRAAETQPAAVSWHDALAFCRWLTVRLRDEALRALARPLPDRERAFWAGLAEGRLTAALPSEAEWEKAARGADGRRFPWGDAADPNRANCQDAGIGAASAVGCFPGGTSPLGVEEMSGNVWEWTRSLWGEDDQEASFRHPYDPTDGREDVEAPDAVRRVLRGGGFHSPARSIRAASRMGQPPETVSPNCGFRVAVVPVSAMPAVEPQRPVV